MNRLYKISGTGHNYSFCEYVCPKLEENFEIDVPDEIINNRTIDRQEFLDELLNTGLIDKLLYNDIIQGIWEQTFYFVATTDRNGNWICKRLKEENGKLKGTLPKWYDKYAYEIALTICLIVFVIILYFIVGLFTKIFGFPN